MERHYYIAELDTLKSSYSNQSNQSKNIRIKTISSVPKNNDHSKKDK